MSVKTQKEIEKLANEWAVNNAEISFAENSSLNKGYIKGYSQCQEDMVDKIEIKWNEYRTVTNNEDAWLFKQWLISSLNKQD